MAQIQATIGRIRVTKAAYPSEAGYIRSMRLQTDELERVIQQVARKVGFATPDAIVYALQPIFDRSQELVPVDTGKLKRSGFLKTDREYRSGRVRAQVGYAQHGQPHYAAFVHEMLHIPHHSPAGASAKFLEIAVNEKLGSFKDRLVARMTQQVGLKG
jgi:hypothetical protein